MGDVRRKTTNGEVSLRDMESGPRISMRGSEHRAGLSQNVDTFVDHAGDINGERPQLDHELCRALGLDIASGMKQPRFSDSAYIGGFAAILTEIGRRPQL